MKRFGEEPEKPVFEPLAVRLREVRKHYKLTQAEVTEILDISRSSYQYYERNERDVPASMLIAFIIHFQLDAEWLLFGDAGRGISAQRTKPPETPPNAL